MSKRPVYLRFDPKLLEAIDSRAGSRNRTAWIEAACRARLGLSEATEPEPEGKSWVAIGNSVGGPKPAHGASRAEMFKRATQ